MKRWAFILTLSLVPLVGFAQPSAPALDYVPVADSFALPPGANFGSVTSVAINSKGHIFVLNRGTHPLMEFDPGGRFVRTLGEGLFSDRAHGLRVDAEDNLWAADGGFHVVYKLSPQGRLLLVLGQKGTPGEFHFANKTLKLFTEPNDVAIAPNGDIYVAQGHGKGDSRILKFTRDGTFVKHWGRTGKAQGEFDVPHAVIVDTQGLVHVADRGNQRIQVFDAEGNYLREWAQPGTPAGLHLHRDGFLYLANGHMGNIVKLELNGKVIGSMGGQGKGLGQYGEAHYITVSPRGEIYVADTLNWRVQKYVKR